MFAALARTMAAVAAAPRPRARVDRDRAGLTEDGHQHLPGRRGRPRTQPSIPPLYASSTRFPSKAGPCSPLANSPSGVPTGIDLVDLDNEARRTVFVGARWSASHTFLNERSLVLWLFDKPGYQRLCLVPREPVRRTGAARRLSGRNLLRDVLGRAGRELGVSVTAADDQTGENRGEQHNTKEHQRTSQFEESKIRPNTRKLLCTRRA